MRKKSSSRIHVSKVESAREMPLTRQSSMKAFEFKQKDSKIPSTARPKYQNFIPPLKLLPKAISKLEKTPRPETSTLRFLTEPSKYSDPSSINSFITANNFTQQEEDSAKKIQKAWKKMKENKKTYSFIYFAFLLYKSRIKFPMHLWLLARRFPASISKVHYDIVVNYMKTRHYLFNLNDKWLTNDFSSYLLSFDQYCKTNCILIGTQYDIEKIIKFVKILMRPLIKETFKIWREMNETSRVLSKQKPIIKTTYLYRSNFHELFWTFIFWLRWSRYKRTKDIEKSSIVSSSFYLLEWNIFRAKKIQKRNIIHRAFCMRDDRLQYYAFITMRKHCINKIKQRNEFNKIKKVANKNSMSLAFRSFLFYHVQCSIKKSLKYRVLSSWYKISDKSMINKACLTAMKNRKNIRLMMKTLSQWKEGIYKNILFLSYLFDLVQKKYLLSLKIAFFLMKNFVHYQFVSSFIKWKKLILMKKRSKMLLTWSFNHSKENAIKSYLFDIFRENCLHQIDHLNYLPFKSEMDKKYIGIKHSSSEQAPISLNKRKSKLIKLIQSIQETNFSISSYNSTVNDTIRSYQKVEQYPCYEDENWCKKATSDQIKTLFYHLVIIKCYLNKGKFALKLNKEIIQANEIIEYRKNNNLLTMVSLRKHRQKQEELFLVKRKTMIEKLNRDTLLLAKKDVYLALVALNEANPQFTIEPKKIFKESKIIKEGEILSSSSSSSTLNVKEAKEDLEELKMKRKQKHPLLNPIPSLKDGITKTNRKARRPPKQLFTEETNQSAKNRTFRIGNNDNNGIIKGNRINQNETYIVYEKHQKISNENKEKFIQEKKRKEKELLKNMPPPIDKMPTVKNGLPPSRNKQKDQAIQLSSHLEINNESLNKFMSSQDIDLSNKFVSKKPSRLSPLFGQQTDEEEEEEEEAIDDAEKEEEKINEMISQIEKISFPYINNDHYLNQSSFKRRDFLTNKYFSILDILLSKQKRPKPPQIQHFELNEYEEEDEEEDEFNEFELPQNSVSRVLIALMPNRKNKRKRHKTSKVQINKSQKTKLRRKPLFQDRGKAFEKVVGKDGTVYSKSNDPQFSKILFLGDRFMAKLNMSGKLPDDFINNDENKKKTRRIKKGNEEEEDEEEEENLSSTFDIPGFHLLLNEVGNFLKSGLSFELSIDEQEKKMISEKSELGNAEKVMLVMNKLARNAIKSESLNDQIDLNRKMPTNDELVNIDNLTASQDIQSVSDRHSSRSRNSMNRPNKRTKSTRIKLSNHLEFNSTKEKRIKRINRKLKADSPIIIKRKFTFTQDLLNSIHEGSRIAHQIILNYYDDVTKIDPFDGLDTLKKNIKLILLNQSSDSDAGDYSSYYSNESDQKEKEKDRIIKRAFKLSSPEPHQNGRKKPLTENNNSKKQVYTEEFILSINGKQAKKKTKRSKTGQKDVTFHPNTMKSFKPSLTKSDNQSEPLVIDNFSISKTTSNRPKTSWSNVRQEVNLESKKKCDDFTFSNFKVPRKKPLNHITKMTKTLPIESPEFSVIMKENENPSKFDNLNESNVKSFEKVKKLKNPKWIVESDPEITSDDIDFFLFTTPFIIPPTVINDALEKQKK